MGNVKEVWESKSASWSNRTIDPKSYFWLTSDSVAKLASKHLKSGSVLDVGCGSGVLCYKLAQKGFDVFGTDISENMIAETSRRLAALDTQAPTRFRVCRDGIIPFKGQTFDLITAIEVLPYVADWPQFIHNLCNFLNPNGLMILSNVNRRSIAVWHEIGNHFLPMIRRKHVEDKCDFGTHTECIINLFRTGYHSGGFVNYHTSKQCYTAKCLDDLLNSQGFKNIDEISLYSKPFLDSKPFQRTKIGSKFARNLGWEHIGVYRQDASR